MGVQYGNELTVSGNYIVRLLISNKGGLISSDYPEASVGVALHHLDRFA